MGLLSGPLDYFRRRQNQIILLRNKQQKGTPGLWHMLCCLFVYDDVPGEIAIHCSFDGFERGEGYGS